MTLYEAGTYNHAFCKRCATVNELCEGTKRGSDRLCSIQENEQEIGRLFPEMLQSQEPQTSTVWWSLWILPISFQIRIFYDYHVCQNYKKHSLHEIAVWLELDCNFALDMGHPTAVYCKMQIVSFFPFVLQGGYPGTSQLTTAAFAGLCSYNSLHTLAWTLAQRA